MSTFLFVGGTLHRKGIDILLDAYLRAFSAYDEVCLVIKDTGTQTVYRGMNRHEQILGLVQDPNRPAIVYLDDDLSAHRLAGLYTACDCLVQPYRGEGFCLPALEAMACGKPVLVTAGGPTDDFVDETVGWRIPARRQPIGSNKIGEWECVDAPWLFEVDPDELASLLRQVYREREEVVRRGQAASARVRESWTWGHACDAALQRLEALRQEPAPRRETLAVPVPATPLPEKTPPKASPVSKSRGRSKGKRAETPTPPAPSPRTPTISLCMIVKNEERVLGDCLHSARSWVDEIIVVDTGSTDRTVQIAESLGAKVFHFPWIDSFSAARNESLRHATGDWIFWMDADDTLPAASGQAIRSASANAKEEIVGFVIPVQFVDDGSSAGGTRVDHVKLFRNLPGLAFEGRIHEQILPSLRATGGLIARCEAVVLHSGYDTSPEGQARKRERDYKLLKLDLEERPDHPFVLFNLGMTDHYSNEHEAAISWLRRSIQVAAPTDSHVRKAYALLAVSLRELRREDEALTTLREGLQVTPDDPELHFHTGYLMTARGRYTEAKSHYLQTIQADITDHFSSVDMGILGYKTFHNLGGVCLLMKNYPEAKHWWLRAIEAAPQFLPSAFELFNVALEERDAATARQMLAAVQAVEGASENWATMGARYVGALEGPTRAEASLWEAVSQYPTEAGPRLVWVRHLLQAGREEEAVESLKVLEQQGVAEAAFYLGVSAVRRDDLKEALGWMERAVVLNPHHEETRQQVENLKQALGKKTR